MPFFKRRKQSRSALTKSVQGEQPVTEAEADSRARLRAALMTERTGGSGAAPPTLPVLRRLVMWSGITVALIAGILLALNLALDSKSDDEGGLAANPTSLAPTVTEDSVTTGTPTPSAELTTPVPAPPPTVPPASVFCEGGQDAFAYRVKPGDSMATISADYGLFEGDVALCDSSIVNPSLIRPGQIIRIPCPDAGCPEPQP